jgi:ParB family chromosome partitioning protein
MSNEWYTPPQYADAARNVMGGIGLDPASCAAANQFIRATRYYTKADNGLLQPWFGRIWLNPPYGRAKGGSVSFQAEFIRKLLHEWSRHSIAQAVLLCTADPDERWFQPLWRFPLCFAYPQIRFFRPGLPPEKHIMGSCFVYLGSHEDAFTEAFKPFGRVIKAINPPRSVSLNLELWQQKAR